MVHKNKIAIYYSVYSVVDDISVSLFWILALAENLKFYMMNMLWKHVDIIVCTDGWTKKLIDDVIAQEEIAKINPDQYTLHVKWRLFPRHEGSHIGRIWRYYAIVDDEYNQTLIGEVDEMMPTSFLDLDALHTIFSIIQYRKLHCTANAAILQPINGPFLAGRIICNPKKLNLKFKTAIRNLLDALIVDDDSYINVFDEQLLYYVLGKLAVLKPYQNYNAIYCSVLAYKTFDDIKKFDDIQLKIPQYSIVQYFDQFAYRDVVFAHCQQEDVREKIESSIDVINTNEMPKLIEIGCIHKIEHCALKNFVKMQHILRNIFLKDNNNNRIPWQYNLHGKIIEFTKRYDKDKVKIKKAKRTLKEKSIYIDKFFQ